MTKGTSMFVTHSKTIGVPPHITRECPSCSATLAAEAAYCIDCGSPTSPALSADAALGDALRVQLASALGPTFEIERLLGRGGMGAVYLASELLLNRKVAIKVLPPEAAQQTSESRARFMREAQAAAQLTHRHIVPLHSIGEANGTLYFVMGFVDGESLRSVLNREGRLSEDRTRRLLGEIADALAYAHERGIVHRDIKPDNVMIERSTGNAVLTDFGIAKYDASAELTGVGFILGTPQYMSPEQAGAEPTIDGRSDLYSLGVLGYRVASGRLPFEGTGVRELLLKHLTEAPPPLRSVAPDVSEEFASAIDRSLAKLPADRWADAAEFREAVASARRMEKLVARRAWYDGLLLSYVLPVLFLLSVFVVAGTVGERARAPVERSLGIAHGRQHGDRDVGQRRVRSFNEATASSTPVMPRIRWLLFGSTIIPRPAVEFYATTFVTTAVLGLGCGIVLLLAAIALRGPGAGTWRHIGALLLRQPEWWAGWAPAPFRHPALTELRRRYPQWLTASRTIIDLAALYYLCIVLPAVVVVFVTSESDLTDASLHDWPYVKQWLVGGSLVDRDNLLPALAAIAALAAFAWAVRARLSRRNAWRVANGDLLAPTLASLEFAATLEPQRVAGTPLRREGSETIDQLVAHIDRMALHLSGNAVDVGTKAAAAAHAAAASLHEIDAALAQLREGAQSSAPTSTIRSQRELEELRERGASGIRQLHAELSNVEPRSADSTSITNIEALCAELRQLGGADEG